MANRSERPGITYDQVAEAADRLTAAGRRPTIDAVREELGNTGSNNTIHRHLQAWREARPPKPATVLELPQDLTAAILAVIDRAAAAARAEMEGDLVEARAEAKELRQTADDYADEIEHLRGHAERLQEQFNMCSEDFKAMSTTADAAMADYERELARAERLVIALGKADATAEMLKTQLGEMKTAGTKLEALLEAEQKGRAAADTALAVAQSTMEQQASRIADLLKQLHDQGEDLSQTRDARTAADSARTAAEATVKEQGARIAELADQVRTLADELKAERAGRGTAETALASATATLDQIDGRIADLTRQLEEERAAHLAAAEKAAAAAAEAQQGRTRADELHRDLQAAMAVKKEGAKTE